MKKMRYQVSAKCYESFARTDVNYREDISDNKVQRRQTNEQTDRQTEGHRYRVKLPHFRAELNNQ